MKRLKDFFNVKDTEGVTHNGFLSNFTFPVLPVINAVTLSILDDFLYNAISEKEVLARWRAYLDNNGRINPEFYTVASSTFTPYLLHAEHEFDLTLADFRSLTANEVETMVYGAESETSDYGQIRIVLQRGNDSTQAGARTDTTTVSSETDTTTDSVNPFDAQTFQPQKKTDFDKGDETTESTTGAQTVTNTYGDQTNTTSARQDAKSKATHTDTQTTSRVVIMTPEKYFEVQKELANIGAYELIEKAVNRCFCLHTF